MERIEKLDYDLQIFQNSELYTFTSDAVLLAKFVNLRKDDVVVDLGTGSGIIALYLAKKGCSKKVIGVEIQTELAKMAEKSVKLNKLEDKIEIINKNMKEVKLSADVVVANPPYKKLTSLKNQNSSRAIARHEVEINLDELLTTASKMLNTGGRFYICYDSNRLAELIYKLKAHKLEPKALFLSYPNINKDASIVFIEAIKDGKEGIKILPPVITNGDDGKYIENLIVRR